MITAIERKKLSSFFGVRSFCDSRSFVVPNFIAKLYYSSEKWQMVL